MPFFLYFFSFRCCLLVFLWFSAAWLALIHSLWWLPLILYLSLLVQHQETVQQLLWYWMFAGLASSVFSLHLNSGHSQQNYFTEVSVLLIEFWSTSESYSSLGVQDNFWISILLFWIVLVFWFLWYCNKFQGNIWINFPKSLN